MTRLDIDASESFVAYVDDLRETWPHDPELAAKHGVPAGNGQFQPKPMSETTDETELHNHKLERRAFLAAAAATAATASGAGGVSAQETTGELNFGSDFVQDPWIEGTTTVAEVDRESMGELDFVADDGTESSLAEMGGVLAPRDEEDQPHNPIRLRGDLIHSNEYTSFPRDETFTNADDEEEDLNAVDATHWTVDESGTTGSLTLNTVTSDPDGDALEVQAVNADGDIGTATFTDFEISSGEMRKYLQLVVNVRDLPSATTVTFVVRDSDGDERTARIDSAADRSEDGVVANEVADGVVFQTQVGDLNGSAEMNTIEEFEIQVENGDVDLLLSAINLERESRWEYGTQEYLNSDEEVDTQTMYEPAGQFAITSLDTLGSRFDSATLGDVEYDVHYYARELPSENINFEFSDAERYDQEYRFEAVYNFEIETHYDLGHQLDRLADEQLYPSSRYLATEIVTDQDEQVALEDVEDLDWTDVSTEYDGSIGDEGELSTALSAGTVDAVHFDILVKEDEREDMEAVAAAGPTGKSSGGIFDWITTLPGMIVAGLSSYGIVRYLGILPGIGGD